MNRASRRTEGFTLIELLVVIAILSLLIAVLLPTLGQARAVANFTACRANMRSMAIAWNGYATNHEGRYPGYALSSAEHWGPCWMQILNREWYANNDKSYYPPPGSVDGYWDEPTHGPLLRFWSFWTDSSYSAPEPLNGVLHKRWLGCPEYIAWRSGGGSNIWSRPWIANDYAVGGHYGGVAGTSNDWWDNMHPTSNNDWYYYSKISPTPQNVNPAYYFYRLGAQTDKFKRTANKYLVWEAEAGNDMDRYGNGLANGTVLLNGADGTKAPWVSSNGTSGELAFRHLKPRDVRLYQRLIRSSALYMDGHAGPVNPNTYMFAPDLFYDP